MEPLMLGLSHHLQAPLDSLHNRFISLYIFTISFSEFASEMR